MFKGFDLSGRVAVVIGGTSSLTTPLAIEWVRPGVTVPAASVVTDEILLVDGRFLASGVHQ